MMTELDDAYANRDHVPGADDLVARWPLAAQAFRQELGERAQSGLRYGDSDRQVFDLFAPEGTSQGTVVFIHGGYWRLFDSSCFSHLAAGALARGWTVAMPSYDLCPTVRIAEITSQIATAVQMIAGMTSGPMSIAGHSAGGHLACRMMDRDVLPEAVAGRVQAVVPISPLSDLRPFLRTSMNEDFQMDETSAMAESPILTEHRHAAPVTVWVGSAERPAFLDQARWLSEAWGAEMVVSPGKHHFNVIDPLEQPGSLMVRTLVGA
ncbi:MAG: alpha/beta hydrolase [Paracoccaceae bacterium]